MKPLPDGSNIRIAGAWNPAIITPQWVAREVLGVTETFQVGMQVPMGFGGVTGGVMLPQRHTFLGLSMTVGFDLLEFFLPTNDDEKANLGITSAAKIMEVLSHTPVVALGINFGYGLTPNAQLDETFAGVDRVGELVPEQTGIVVQKSWSAAVKLERQVMNVSCMCNAEGVRLDFNHHFEVDCRRAAALLREDGLYTRLRDMSRRLAENFDQEEQHEAA